MLYTRVHACTYFDDADDEPVTTAGDEQTSGQLSTDDGEYLILYTVSTTHCTHYYCDIVTHYHEVRVTASKEEQQRLLQVVEQYQGMGRVRDVQISQLQNENELVQARCM